MSTDQRIYRGQALSDRPSSKAQNEQRSLIPDPPPWRVFTRIGMEKRGTGFLATPAICDAVNAAICLRRPILVQGAPGTGKTTLAYSAALELGLPGPYRWGITSRSTLKD